MTIRTRLLIALLLAAAGGTLIIERVASRLIHRAVVSRAVQRLTAEARYLELGLHRSWPASVAEADARADEAGRALEARVSILDPAGRVLGDSHVPMHDLGSLENHATRPEIVDAAASGTGHAERLSRSVGELERYVALRVGPRESPRGFVRLAVPVERLGAESGIHGSLVTVISGAGLLLFAALAHVLVSRHSRPIARIAAAADQVSSGRLSEPIGRESDDELGRLAASVDRMRRTLTEQIGRADSERKLLGSILGGLREGILAVNHDRRLLLINASLRRTLELDRESPEGTPLIQLAWDRSILEAFDEALGGASEVRRRVELAGGRSFELTVVPFSDGAGRQAGAIGLFFDVTRLDALERVRRDFIADISHELRTPLASARASSETLQAGALAEPGDADRFLSILSRNLSRMESILNDLTDLSLIETGGISLSRTTVDLSAAVRESAVSIAPRASAREVEIRTDIPAGMTLNADRRRLDQILVNLLDNAVKFNRKGGSVVVSAMRRNGSVRLTIEDTGAGIPPDALDRVFHRLYRVDRARSRDVPGTGLGLAIVKHLVRLHGGEILAENREEGGARFTITLPAGE